MKYTLIDSYKNTLLSPREINDVSNRIIFTFNDGPKVEILGDKPEEYEVDFVNQDKTSITYSTKIKNNMWCCSSIKYFVNWLVNVKRDGVLVAQEKLNLAGKQVKIVFDTQSIGDLIAYIGPASEFQKKHQCALTCVVFHEELRGIFKASYSNITFLGVDERPEDYYATYRVGWFNEWKDRAPENPQRMCLANIASDILGLGRRDFKPTLSYVRPPTTKKYVCIGMQSTAQFKYWNNPTGWDTVVSHLKKLGYEVWCIDRYSTFGIKGHMNHMPKGCIDKTGEVPLTERLSQLAGADFFIGLSSGLSWMAWAVNTPVILISGVGERWTEFFTPHRIINKSVCHACTNDDAFKFDKNDWLFCPRKKNFECTAQISSTMVIDEIDKLQTEFYRKTLHNLDWGSFTTTGEKELLFREIYLDRTYERFLKVEKGDVVMDIGAHVGAVSVGMLRHTPSLIVAVEPSALRVEILKKNLAGHPVKIINAGLGDKKEFIKNGLEYDKVVEDFPVLPISDIMTEAGITQIDYLKIDCEGGEYSLFTPELFPWVSRNIKKIVGELHLEDKPRKDAFRKFRDTYLTKMNLDNFHIFSVDGVDIKWDLFNEHFIEYYEEVIFAMDNRGTFVPSNPLSTLVPDMSALRTTPGPVERQGLPLNTNPDFYRGLFKLDGKVAVVTGGGGHLGSAMTMGLLAHGARVIVLGRHVETIFKKLFTPENTLKDKLTAIHCDVEDETQVSDTVTRIINSFGRIDILVNNAFNEKRKPFEQLTKDDWEHGFDAICTQQFLCSKHILPHMVKQGRGSIINVGSIYGFQGIDQRAYQEVPSSTVFYSVAKAGAIQLAKELSVQYATKGIRVNSISPGHFPKPPTDPTKANPKYVALLASMVPMQRVGCADEIAGAVVFLASDASSYVTGHNLVIDGGRSVW